MTRVRAVLALGGLTLGLAALSGPDAWAATSASVSTGSQRACFQVVDHPIPVRQMPPPVRLRSPESIYLGTNGPDTLEPPLPTQNPAIVGSTLKALVSPNDRTIGRGETVQLVLARLTSRLPTTTLANGRLVPMVEYELAWVLVSRHAAFSTAGASVLPAPGSKRPKVQCLYGTGVLAWDAGTGKEIVNQSYAP